MPSLITPSYSLHSFKPPSIASINNLLLSVKSVWILDPIPLILLNKLTTLLSPLYKHIIDLSLISGTVPAHMKNVHVTPILKKIIHMINLISPTTVQFPIYHIYKLLKSLIPPNYMNILTIIKY